jgi:hypothetical protein
VISLGACGSDATSPPDVASPPEEFQIDEGGGTITAQGGRVSLTVPPGALSDATTITIERVAEPVDSELVPGTFWDFGPDGLQFDEPVTLRLAFDPSAVPAEESPEDLRVFKRSGTDWLLTADGRADVATATVTGEITSFSEYAIRVASFEPLSLGTEALPAAIDDWPYSGGFAVSGGARPYSWRLSSGTLPAGLTLDPEFGLLEGTPTAVGTVGATVEVASQDGQTFERTFAITVNPRPVLTPAEFCADNPPYAVVSFESPALERVAREYVVRGDSIRGIGPREHFSCDIMESITGLGVDTTGVELSLLGIQNLVNLKNFGSNGNVISDLSPLASLVDFDGPLGLIAAEITDVTPLAALTRLTDLSLANNSITNIDALSALTRLQVLELNDNSIRDIDALRTMPDLQVLNLDRNRVSSIAWLGENTELGIIYLRENLLIDPDSVPGFPRVTSLGSLQNLPKLYSLGLEGNDLVNVNPLINNPDFGSIPGSNVSFGFDPTLRVKCWDRRALEAKGVDVSPPPDYFGPCPSTPEG